MGERQRHQEDFSSGNWLTQLWAWLAASEICRLRQSAGDSPAAAMASGPQGNVLVLREAWVLFLRSATDWVRLTHIIDDTVLSVQFSSVQSLSRVRLFATP